MKILKAIGIIVLFLIIYQLAQVFVMLVAGFVHIVGLVWTSTASGTELALDELVNEIITYMTAQTPWILLLAIAITVPTYYLFYRERRQELLTFVRFRGIGLISIPVVILFGLSVSYIMDLLLALVSQIEALKPLFDTYEQVSELIFSGGFILSLISVGIIAPVFEEILFRGLIFGELRKITKVKLALVLQALLFGIYHFNVVQGVYAFLLGLVIGFVYYRSNSIIAPILMHISINSLSVILTQLIGMQQLEQWGVVILVASVALFFLTGAFILTSKSFKRSMDDSLYFNNRPQKKTEEDVSRDMDD